jgi:hypothetical protein
MVTGVYPYESGYWKHILMDSLLDHREADRKDWIALDLSSFGCAFVCAASVRLSAYTVSLFRFDWVEKPT